MLYQMADIENPTWHLNLNTGQNISCGHTVNYSLTYPKSWGNGYQRVKMLKK